MEIDQVIAAFYKELKEMEGKSIPQELYGKRPDEVEAFTPGLYHVINTKLTKNYPLEFVSYFLLRPDGTGLSHWEDLKPDYDAAWPGEGLDMLLDWQHHDCRVVKIA